MRNRKLRLDPTQYHNESVNNLACLPRTVLHSLKKASLISRKSNSASDVYWNEKQWQLRQRLEKVFERFAQREMQAKKHYARKNQNKYNKMKHANSESGTVCEALQSDTRNSDE